MRGRATAISEFRIPWLLAFGWRNWLIMSDAHSGFSSWNCLSPEKMQMSHQKYGTQPKPLRSSPCDPAQTLKYHLATALHQEQPQIGKQMWEQVKSTSNYTPTLRKKNICIYIYIYECMFDMCVYLIPRYEERGIHLMGSQGQKYKPHLLTVKTICANSKVYWFTYAWPNPLFYH